MSSVIKKAWNNRSNVDWFMVGVMTIVMGFALGLPIAVALGLHAEVPL